MTDNHPELTTIPADAYWPKGGAVQSSALPPDSAFDDWCLKWTNVPDDVQEMVGAFVPAYEVIPWTHGVVCYLRKGHSADHISHLADSRSDAPGGFWVSWEQVGTVKLCILLHCIDRDDCGQPAGHEGAHGGAFQ